jgi:CubicO group peptidase (beta-lactamase class C family)
MFKKIISLIFVCSVHAQNFQDFENFVEEARKNWNVPGAAISIVQGNKVIFAKGFGVCHIDRPDQVNKDTIFQIASITKTFTAAGLGVLVDQKAVKWDQAIRDHLPEFQLKVPYSSTFATARDLLAHRTGLPSFGGDLLGKLGYSSQEILRRIRFIEPATSFRNTALYSNVGFFIAGELLSRVNHSSWEEAMMKFLFDPLSMRRSGFSSNLENSNVAFSHAEFDQGICVIPWDPTGGFPAAGAITSTASDLANWMIMHVNCGAYKGKQLLKKETLEEIFSPSMVAEISFSETPPIDPNAFFSYGLGWGTYQYQGKKIVEKGGGLDGVRTLITLIPELQMGICILCNLNLTLFPEAIRANFLETYLGKSSEDLQAKIRQKSQELSNLLKEESPPDQVIPLSQPLENYTGSFTNELYGIFRVCLNDGKLMIHAGPGKLQGSLAHFSRDTFMLHWPAVNSGAQKVTFTFGPENQPLQFETETLGTFIKGTENYD